MRACVFVCVCVCLCVYVCVCVCTAYFSVLSFINYSLKCVVVIISLNCYLTGYTEE